MKYYKLYASIDPLDQSTYQMVYDTIHLSHAPELGLKSVRFRAQRYLDAGCDCYIREIVESTIELHPDL